jgi:hypothetical protein
VTFNGANILGAGTITAGLLAANAVIAGNIAAGAVTATQLSAGIVKAGIVNGTLISGAQFVAYGTTGEILVYSGTPASGNLIMSVSPSAGTDSQGNSYKSGAFVYNSSGGSIGMTPAANTALDLTPGVTPAAIAGTAQLFANSGGHAVVQDGGDGQAYQIQRRTLVSGSDSGTLTGLSTLGSFTTTLGPAQYRVHAQLYIAIATSGPDVQCQFTGSGSLVGAYSFILSHGGTVIAQTGGPNSPVGAGVTQGAGGWILTLDGVLGQTVTGLIELQAGSSTGTGIIVQADSWIEYMPV